MVLLRPDGTDRVSELIEVVLEERVPVVVTGAGSAQRFTAVLTAAGCKVGHVVPSPDLARKALAAGVHFVVAESVESGGHVRPGGLATLSLVPQVVDTVACPVAAAGGVVDGRGVLAALALGADGVQMGTRFVATAECEAHEGYKRAVVAAGPEASVLYGQKLRLSRGLATPIVRRLVELDRNGEPAHAPPVSRRPIGAVSSGWGGASRAQDRHTRYGARHVPPLFVRSSSISGRMCLAPYSRRRHRIPGAFRRIG